MGRQKIVAGNWKMNKVLVEATTLVDDVIRGSADNTKVEKIFFVPTLFLQSITQQISNKPGFFTGAQNCSEHVAGAFTGEISAAMLRSVGCRFVLVGHSERRQYFNETAGQQKAKIKLALSSDLKVIYCVGEKLTERKNNSHFEVVAQQLKEVLETFSEKELKEIYLAYEPVWAIGTGETASPAQAQEMHAFIRKKMAELFSLEIANSIPILYGGSCNPQNAKELFACADVDGGLIGGASLKADDFCKIIGSF